MRGEEAPGQRLDSPPERPALEVGSAVLGKEIFPEWAELVQLDAEAAHDLHRAVLVELETRRRSAEGIRECFGDEAIGELDLRFAVAVVATGDRIEIGGADFVEVTAGTPVPAATTECLEAALDGERVLEASEVSGGTVRYDGRIEYVARFSF